MAVQLIPKCQSAYQKLIKSNLNICINQEMRSASASIPPILDSNLQGVLDFQYRNKPETLPGKNTTDSLTTLLVYFQQHLYISTIFEVNFQFLFSLLQKVNIVFLHKNIHSKEFEAKQVLKLFREFAKALSKICENKFHTFCAVNVIFLLARNIENQHQTLNFYRLFAILLGQIY